MFRAIFRSLHNVTNSFLPPSSTSYSRRPSRPSLGEWSLNGGGLGDRRSNLSALFYEAITRKSASFSSQGTSISDYPGDGAARHSSIVSSCYFRCRRREIYLAKLMATIIFLYIFATTPINIVVMYQAMGSNRYSLQSSHFIFCLFLVYLNAVISPLLQSFNPGYKRLRLECGGDKNGLQRMKTCRSKEKKKKKTTTRVDKNNGNEDDNNQQQQQKQSMMITRNNNSRSRRVQFNVGGGRLVVVAQTTNQAKNQPPVTIDEQDSSSSCGELSPAQA